MPNAPIKTDRDKALHFTFYLPAPITDSVALDYLATRDPARQAPAFLGPQVLGIYCSDDEDGALLVRVPDLRAALCEFGSPLLLPHTPSTEAAYFEAYSAMREAASSKAAGNPKRGYVFAGRHRQALRPPTWLDRASVFGALPIKTVWGRSPSGIAKQTEVLVLPLRTSPPPPMPPPPALSRKRAPAPVDLQWVYESLCAFVWDRMICGNVCEDIGRPLFDRLGYIPPGSPRGLASQPPAPKRTGFYVVGAEKFWAASELLADWFGVPDYRASKLLSCISNPHPEAPALKRWGVDVSAVSPHLGFHCARLIPGQTKTDYHTKARVWVSQRHLQGFWRAARALVEAQETYKASQDERKARAARERLARAQARAVSVTPPPGV